ncbi:MAG TPA: spore germination protein GerW family protein [Gemmatimonadales bacterium]|nr:spore germination protein GerW family protein [Gemmatimonadales bacterium]
MDVDELLSGARDVMTVKRVYGDPIERDGVMIIPAANVVGGGGGGGDKDNNGGGGFGVTATPAGAWVIRDGEVEWEPAVDATRIATLGMVVAIIFLLVVRSIAKGRAKVKLQAAKAR